MYKRKASVIKKKLYVVEFYYRHTALNASYTSSNIKRDNIWEIPQ